MADVGNVLPVDADGAAPQVAEAPQQGDAGALAAARMADQGEALAGCDAPGDFAMSPVVRRANARKHNP